MESYIRMNNLEKTYKAKGETPVKALRNATLEIAKGEMLAITGVSGSGKSTLLHLLGLLDRPTSGELFFEKNIDTNVRNAELARMRNSKVGFVFQDFALIPYQTAYENIEVPLIFAKVSKAKRQARILALMRSLHIEDLKDRKVSKLSGGEKQRVAIARALANDPPLILADEPTGALDSATKAEILKIFRDIHRQGKTILLVTHDPEVAAIADRRLHISDGILSEVL
jgi:putative ABC transport system ATP-binding protein